MIGKFKTRNVWAKSAAQILSLNLKDDICAEDLVEMGQLSSKNWGVKYLLCARDAFPKYTWVKPLNNKKTKTVAHGFIEIVNKHKPNKL